MVLDFNDALALLLEHLPGNGVEDTELVGLLASRGRILAENIKADRDQPPFDRSTRDGFAVRFDELNMGTPLRVLGMVRAGETWAGSALASGQAIEIMTGAPVPRGADAVVMVEHVVREAGSVRMVGGRVLRAMENVVPRGGEAGAGWTLLRQGTSMGAAEIALAASCGRPTVEVYRRPRVAIVATGDELVELDITPEPYQIRNSNSYALAALVEAVGGEPVRLPAARDERGALLEAISAARGQDLLVLSGGVSMGEYDLVESVLDALGARFFFTGVAMQPGKPVVFGCLPATLEHPEQYFFGLPGNPISTQVTFRVFVEPMLRALCGAQGTRPPFVLAKLAEAVPGKPGLTRLLPGLLTGVDVRLVGWQGSGDLTANAQANCYVLLPADVEAFRVGELVRVLLR